MSAPGKSHPCSVPPSRALSCTPVTWEVGKAAGTVPSSRAKPSQAQTSWLPCALPGLAKVKP